MRTITLSKFFKVIEWFIFICLLAVSAYFMYGVFEQYFSGKSSFTQSERRITELPSITMCFSSNGVFDGDVKYQYESDFKIEYLVEWPDKSVGFLKEGKNFNKYNETIFLKKITTTYTGTCYKVASTKPSINKGQYRSLILHFADSVTNNDSLPYVKIYVTSEKNSYGVVRQSWLDGNVKQILIKKNVFKQINLKPQHILYNKKASICREESFYESFQQLYITKLNNCSKKCSHYSLPSIPMCKTDEEIECAKHAYERLYKNIRWQPHNDTHFLKPCVMFEYLGEETWTSKLSDYFNGTHGLGYQFDPPESVMVHEEYLIYDEIRMLASVGGTLGMCIGFSFTNVIKYAMDSFQDLLWKCKQKSTTIY